jgi:hypothetical protein
MSDAANETESSFSPTKPTLVIERRKLLQRVL